MNDVFLAIIAVSVFIMATIHAAHRGVGAPQAHRRTGDMLERPPPVVAAQSIAATRRRQPQRLQPGRARRKAVHGSVSRSADRRACGHGGWRDARRPVLLLRVVSPSSATFDRLRQPPPITVDEDEPFSSVTPVLPCTMAHIPGGRQTTASSSSARRVLLAHVLTPSSRLPSSQAESCRWSWRAARLAKIDTSSARVGGPDEYVRALYFPVSAAVRRRKFVA